MQLQMSMIIILFTITFSSAEKLFQMKIGPAWPDALWNTGKPTAWDASLQSGAIFDDRIAIGCAVDFLWNNDAKEEKITDDLYKVDILQRTIMFPVMAFLSIYPAPKLPVQPCFSGYIGLNTMYCSFKGGNDSIVLNSLSYKPINIDDNGWYMGLIWKLSGDIIVRLGENSGLLSGIEYQWSKPRKLSQSSGDLYIFRNMSGLGIRFGVKFSY